MAERVKKIIPENSEVSQEAEITTIPEEEARFDPISYVDPNGKVFVWRREIYRAITPAMTDYFKWLVSQDVFKKLQEKEMIVETRETEYILGGCGLVLKHKKIEPITYCFEWPPQMLKDAAILTLEICVELIKKGLILQDAYPWNIQFVRARPILIDVASIIRLDQNILWEAYQEFCNFFLYPLYLYSIKLTKTPKLLLTDYLNGISEERCYILLPFRRKFFRRGPFCRLTFPLIAGKIVQGLGLQDKVRIWANKVGSKTILNDVRLRFFEGLLGEVRSIKIPVAKTQWSLYYTKTLSYAPSEDWTPKQKSVFDILNKLKPQSVLDIACNKGWYSILAARQGARVISFDKDDNCISSLYESAKRERLDITPIVMDLLNPSPQFGWALKQFPSAGDRLKADLCFAFAVIHHTILSQWQDFSRFIEAIDIFVTRWALIEFIPKEDEKARLLLARKKDVYRWYTLENFLKSLSRKYSVEGIYDSFPPGRKLILCKKT